MKKLVILGSAALIAAIMFTSCKRNYTCVCNTTSKVNDSVTSVTYSKQEFKSTKTDAKNRCTNNTWWEVNNAGDTTKSNRLCHFE